MDAKEAASIVSAIKKSAVATAPDAEEKTMYGGTVYELSDGTNKRLFCGIFVRKNYVTVEFDRGAELDDEKHLLEGAGKARRHLTIHTYADIASKDVAQYIKQSYALPAR